MVRSRRFVILAVAALDFDQNGDNNLKIVSIYATKQVTDPAQTTGVCGSKTAKNACFTWASQVDFAKVGG